MRTLPLAAVFADTKGRAVGTYRFSGTVQLVKESLIQGADKIVAGIDGKFGMLDNTYYDMLTGTSEDYRAYSGDRGGISAEAEGSRSAIAGFVQYDFTPLPRLRFTLGGRYDAINDSYVPNGGENSDASHSGL